MKYNPDRHNRQSIRLKYYDYSQQGFYYVTICTQDRKLLFGDVCKNDTNEYREASCGCSSPVMKLNSSGQMVDWEWNQIPKRYAYVILDKYVIMPNHFHGILQILNGKCTGVGTPLVGVLSADGYNNEGHKTHPYKEEKDLEQKRMGTSPIPTLFDIIGTFKSITTTKYITGVKQNNWPPFRKRVWQLRYHDRIIRNENELDRIRKYVIENPLKWDNDENNPNNFGSH